MFSFSLGRLRRTLPHPLPRPLHGPRHGIQLALELSHVLFHEIHHGRYWETLRIGELTSLAPDPSLITHDSFFFSCAVGLRRLLYRSDFHRLLLHD